MNSAERWEKIKDIFESALERTGGERRAYLEGACGSDREMLLEIESLLSSFDAGYLEGAAVEEVVEAFVSQTYTQLKPGAVVGQYKIAAELGKGGQGSVYKAVDTKLNRPVAIKVLPADLTIDDTARKRFHREAQLASSLDHPNICGIHDLVEADGLHLIVMQFVEGRNVRDFVGGRPLDLSLALRIGIQVCDALAAAHERGIIHRDIKAHNVIVTPAGSAKVLDFGLAKLTSGDDADRTELTDLGAPYGTPTYAAPEQSRGDRADYRADIFSTGVLIYEMLTGSWAFHGKTAIDVRHAVMYNEPAPIADKRRSEIPPRLAEIVDRALKKEPAKRFQSIAEMRDQLLHVLRELPESSTSENARFISTMRPFTLVRRSSTPALTAAAGLLVLLLGAAAYFAYRWMTDIVAAVPAARKLTRLTFEPGLQSKPSWSPDGRLIAYYSNKSGNFDIWVQQVAGGDAVQVTRSQAHDWQPDFSPDGNSIVFRSEREGGGLFVIPALGGTERKISSTGYDPHWSPDGSRILFYNVDLNGAVAPPRVYTIRSDGSDLQEVWQQASTEFVSYMRADWHPDGKRVSFIGQLRRGDLGFYTVPIGGGESLRSSMSDQVKEQVRQLGVTFYDFAWAASGKAIFLEGDTNGVRNLWKVAIEPNELRWNGTLERLTTGAGKDNAISVSPDAKMIAFTTQTEQTQIWSFPWDAASGKLKGEGMPVTSAGMDTGEFALSRDHKRLAFVAKRAGKLEIWEKSLDDGKERLMLTAADQDVVSSPRWSPAGEQIAFARNHNPDPEHRKFTQTFEKSIVLLPIEDGSEQAFTSPNVLQGWPWDWSADGRFILGSSAVSTPDPEHWGLYLFPLNGAPRAEEQQKLVFDDPRYNIWQGRFSPDGKWISFLAGGVADETDGYIGVVPISGGVPVILATGDCDKPRWSPNGKLIYFYSNRSGFRNVWAAPFDTREGKPAGPPFRVTDFRSPDRMLIGSPLIGHGAMINDLAASPDRVVVNITQISGSVWILDNVGD